MKDVDLSAIGADIAALVQAMGNHLAGKNQMLQSAALADLLATWVAGHIIKRDAVATEQLREELLAKHLELVRALIPVNAAAIHEPEDTPHAHHP